MQLRSLFPRAAVRSVALAACSLGLMLPGQRAAAELPRTVPADASSAIWINDTQAFWQKAATLPLTRGLRQFLDNPLLAQKLDFQELLLEKDKAAARLGFPVTPDELLGSVFKSLVFVRTADAPGRRPQVLLSLGVGDKAKAQKLVDVLIEDMREDAKTTGTTFSGATITETTIEGKKLTQVAGEQTRILGLVDDKQFIIAESADEAARAIRALGGESQGVPADYERLAKAVPIDKADIGVWFDLEGMAPGLPPGVVPTANKMLMSLNTTPTGLDGRMANTADPGQLSANVKPGQLNSLVYLAAQPIAAVSSHQIDFEYVLNQLEQMGAVSRPAIEQSTGISFDQELFPALGNELGFLFNTFAPNPDMPMIPLVDAALVLKVDDAAKAAAVMQKVEKMIEQAQAAQNQAQGLPPQSFQSGAGGVRGFAMMPGVGLSYIIDGDYLLIGPNDTSLTSALARKAAPATSLQNSALLKDALAGLPGSAYYDAGTLSVYKLVNELLVPYIGMIPGAARNPDLPLNKAFLTDVVAHLGTISAASTSEGGLLISQIKVVMQ